jgi:hypothetical protein
MMDGSIESFSKRRLRKAGKEALSGENIHNNVAEPVTISLRVSKMPVILLYIALSLSALSFLALFLKRILLWDNFFANALTFYFDLSEEGNVPTFFSSVLLLTAAIMCLLIYKARHSLAGSNYMTNCWLVLAIVFAFLSVDEAARIHEQFSKEIKVGRDEAVGYLHHSWIIPYALFACASGLYFLNFIRRLPLRTSILFVLAGIAYVAAAVGFEPFEGHFRIVYGKNSVYDKLLCNIEESLEMGSIILFIYALSEYMVRQKLTLLFERPAAEK